MGFLIILIVRVLDKLEGSALILKKEAPASIYNELRVGMSPCSGWNAIGLS